MALNPPVSGGMPNVFPVRKNSFILAALSLVSAGVAKV
jgi:hypothetical protein